MSFSARYRLQGGDSTVAGTDSRISGPLEGEGNAPRIHRVRKLALKMQQFDLANV